MNTQNLGNKLVFIAVALCLFTVVGWIEWITPKTIISIMSSLAVRTVTALKVMSGLPKKQKLLFKQFFDTREIGSYSVTSYRSVPAQTKKTGYTWTSIGERTNSGVVAVSQDLLEKNGGPLRYHDTICIEDIGCRQVLDCMNERHKQRLDFWVATYDQEKAFDKKFRGKKLKVWVLKLPEGFLK